MMTTDTQQEIIRLYQSGLSSLKVAKQIGCCKRTILKTLIDNKIDRHQDKLRPEHRDQVARLLEELKSTKAVAAVFGVQYTRILRYVKQHGLRDKLPRVAFDKELIDDVVQTYSEGGTVTEAAHKHGLTHRDIIYHLKKRKVWRHRGVRRYTANMGFFRTIDTEQKAYWLGFIYADGNVSRNVMHIGVQRGDAKSLETFNRHINGTYPIRIAKYISHGKASHIARIDVSSAEMVDDLKRLGVIEHKTGKIAWSNVTSALPSNLLRHFIRGYFDGDGSWSANGKGGVTFKLGVKGYGFLSEMIDYMRQELGLTSLSQVRPMSEKRHDFLVYDNSKHEDKVAIYHYFYDDCSICLERKRDKANKALFIRSP